MSERTRLSAVILDAGGTLVRLDFEWMVEQLAGLGVRTTVEDLRQAEVAGRRRYDASTAAAPTVGVRNAPLGSTGDIREYFAGMFEAVGVSGALLQSMAEILRTRETKPIGVWGRAAEGAADAVAALHHMGMRVAVVSNSDGRAEDHLVHSGVRKHLEFVVDSQIVGIEKPDPEIFRLAMRRMELDPARALYVGDLLSVDARGARAAGMEFVLLDPYGDYAPGGVQTIRSIADLPAWVASTYEVADVRAHTEE